MPKTVNEGSGPAVCDDDPGAGMSRVMEKLASRGFELWGLPCGRPQKTEPILRRASACGVPVPRELSMSSSVVPRTSSALDGVAPAAGGGAGPKPPRADTSGATAARPRGASAWEPALPPQCGGTVMAAQWPLRDFLQSGPLASAVPSARLHARQVVRDWGLAVLSEDVELLVSELMTNAVAAARQMGAAAPVRLWLLSDTTQVLILVWDSSPQSPSRGPSDESAESGRGLRIVEALSQHWESCPTPYLGGKVVWALCN